MSYLHYNSHFADQHTDLPGTERPEQEIVLDLDFEEDDPEIDFEPEDTPESFCPDISPDEISCSATMNEIQCSVSTGSEDGTLWDRVKQAGSSNWLRLLLIIGGISVLTQNGNSQNRS
jgi:hypothetical protein